MNRDETQKLVSETVRQFFPNYGVTFRLPNFSGAPEPVCKPDRDHAFTEENIGPCLARMECDECGLVVEMDSSG